MKKQLIRRSAACLLLAVCLCLPADAAFGGGTVSVALLNLREQPEEDAAVVASARLDDGVIIQRRTGNWYKVTFEGLDGYMPADYLTYSDCLTTELGLGCVNGTNVTIRTEPTRSGRLITVLPAGETLAICGIYGPWYFVYVNGQYGYVHSNYVRLLETPQPKLAVLSEEELAAMNEVGRAIVETAEAYLGVPYVWGGTSPDGMDCSGFVHYVFRELGYPVFRTAETLSTNGVEVPPDQLLPGDVLCFRSFREEDNIGHCGIYLGNGQFIHASSTQGCVTVSPLTGTYLEHFVCARRIVEQ